MSAGHLDTFERQVARENERCGHEWAAYPEWDGMTPAQQAAAVELAGRQGQRLASIRHRFTAAGGQFI